MIGFFFGADEETSSACEHEERANRVSRQKDARKGLSRWTACGSGVEQFMQSKPQRYGVLG